MMLYFKLMQLVDLILKALDREDNGPRVPSFVQGSMPFFKKQWQDKYGGGLNQENRMNTPNGDATEIYNLGFDSSWVMYPGPKRIPPPSIQDQIDSAFNTLPKDEQQPGFYITNEGGLYKSVNLQGFKHNYLVHGVIKTEDQWKEWFLQDGWSIDENAESIEQLNKSLHMGLDKKRPHLVIPMGHLALEPIIKTVNMGRISYFSRKNPQFLRKIFDHIWEINEMQLKMICESEVPIVIIPDDCAFKGRTILNPKAYREFIIPYWKKAADIVHKAGKTLIMHSDGLVEPYYPDLINAGIDAHESLEPEAGNDLENLMEKWGDKLSFIGNVDVSNLLSFGTVEEVRQATMATLKAGMSGISGKGYMISPSTDLINTNKLENVEAMMTTIKKYGNY